MRRFAAYLITILVLVPVALAANEAQAQTGRAGVDDAAIYADQDAWARDFTALYSRLREVHPDFDHATPQAEWQSAYEETLAAIPQMTWAEYVLASAAFLNLAQDGHTNVFPFALHGPGFDTQYPIRAYLFEEGLYVTRIGEDAAALAGGRVLQLGNRPADEVVADLMGRIGAGSPMWKVNFGPYLLRYPGFAEALDYSDRDGGLTLTVETPDGTVLTETVHPQA
jgi:hypothetical protein